MSGKVIKTQLNGEFIGVKEKVNTFVVKKSINLGNIVKAQLKISALGLYVAHINGNRIGENYLTPGFTVYNKFIQAQCYDISKYIKEGENLIEFTVNRGWYSGRFGLDKSKEFFGKECAVIANLKFFDADNNMTEIVTDKSWTATESHIVFSGIYDGEEQDYTRELKDLSVIEIAHDKNLFSEQMCEFVKDKEKFSVKKVIITPKGERVYDFGQNISGIAVVRAPAQSEIILQFAEILDQNGNFYMNNLRSAKGTFKVKTKEKITTNCEFTYFGFRYVKIVTENVAPEDITAVSRYTDMERRGQIKVGHKKLNRFIENTLWSLRDNFVDIPTDCPQRDERLGWTGDINAFCISSAYMYDVRNFLKKWLACLRADQREDGQLPVVTPNVLEGFFGTMSMWCDSAIMIPYKLYVHYGDITFLEDNYDMMKKYISAREDNCENGMIAKGFEYGDWLALDSEECVENKVFGGTDLRYIGNVFYYHCLVLISKIAGILGFSQDEKKYSERGEKLLHDIRREYITSTGRLAVPTVTAHALALEFNIIQDQFRSRCAEELNDKVVFNKYHVTTGFIGTAYFLDALIDNGYWNTAEKVILNEEFPGWLHEVNMGATTVWERWNSLKPDGVPNDEGMTSFNHYAYGAMVEILYRRIAGIKNNGIGFDKILIEPHPVSEMGDVCAEYKSDYGKIISAYNIYNDKIVYKITVPKHTDCVLKLPDEKEISLSEGEYTYERKLIFVK